MPFVLKDAVCAEGYNVMFVFMSPGSPQYNSVVERMFATLYGMLCSTLNQVHLPMTLCHGIWAEAAHYAADMCNYFVTSKSPCYLMRSLWVTSLTGLIFYMILVKWQSWKIIPVMVCAASYRTMVSMLYLLVQLMNILVIRTVFLNLLTNRIIMSRDVI
jgi:hypothetical protein